VQHNQHHIQELNIRVERDVEANKMEDGRSTTIRSSPNRNELLHRTNVPTTTNRSPSSFAHELQTKRTEQSPSPLSYAFQLDEYPSYVTQQYRTDRYSTTRSKSRSCLPGYPIQHHQQQQRKRASLGSKSTSANKASDIPASKTHVKPSKFLQSHNQSGLRSSKTRSKDGHQSMSAIQTDIDITMIEHQMISILPSLSLPSNYSVHSNLKHSSSSSNNSSSNHRPSIRTSTSRGGVARTPPPLEPSLRRPRNTTSSISRSATAALSLANNSPSTIRSSTSRGRQNHSYSASSPSKRSSSQQSNHISGSSQLSTGTATISYQDDDDIGTVSTRRSDRSSNNRYSTKPPSPMTTTPTRSTYRPSSSSTNHENYCNQSTGSTTTKSNSSNGTNTMGNTVRHKQNSKLAIMTSQTKEHVVMVDSAAMKQHMIETHRVMGGTYIMFNIWI
jgi:hypothetical protein